MKTVEATAKFQDVIKDGYALEVHATAEASNFKAALSRAVGQILKSPDLKRKRFTTVSIEASVVK